MALAKNEILPKWGSRALTPGFSEGTAKKAVSQMTSFVRVGIWNSCFKKQRVVAEARR